MSWLRYMTLWSFRKLNPSWKMELFVAGTKEVENYWEGHNKLDFCEYKGEDYFSRLAELDIEIKDCPVHREGAGPPHLCDMCEWSELHHEGGVYCDMDVLWIKPISNLYEQIKEHDVAISFDPWGSTEGGGYFSIGLVASSKGNRFFSDVFKSSMKTFTRSNYQSAGVISIYSLASKNWVSEMNKLSLLKKLVTKYNELSFFNIPMDILHLKYLDHGECFESDYPLVESCIGLHWYGGNPVAQEWNNILTEATVTDYDNLVSRYALHLTRSFV